MAVTAANLLMNHRATPSRMTRFRRIGRFLWTATRGYRFRPWASPYLRWRIETYWGYPAAEIGAGRFFSFTWKRKRDLARFLDWAAGMAAATDASQKRHRLHS